MSLEHFKLIERLCEIGLSEFPTGEFRQHVSRLQGALARQGEAPKSKKVSLKARQQSEVLGQLLDLFSPQMHRTFLTPQQAGSPDAATPETRAKLRPDPIHALLRRGSLEREHVQAADEIRQIYEGLASGLSVRGFSYDANEVPLRQKGSFRQPVERMSERLLRIYRDRYKPWSAEMDARVVGGTTYFVMVTDVIVESRSLRQIERRMTLRNGSATAHLKFGLQRYAEIAGWVPVDRAREKHLDNGEQKR